MNKEKWKALLQKDIIYILDGEQNHSNVKVKDISSGRENDFNAFCEYAMPYLTGPDIVNISNKFGQEVTYDKPQLSRWEYMKNLLNYCIEQNKMQQLLSHLFSKEQFKDQLVGLENPEKIRITHKMIVSEIINLINVQLAFGGNSIKITENGLFYISEEGETPTIETVAIKKINKEYINSIYKRALRDIENLEYDSALTKSRTLLEEVFCFIIEENEKEPLEKGDLGKLYNQVKSLYDMHQKKEVDNRINGLLKGLEKILSSIGRMRNKASDSHGVGSKRFNIEEHHARLYVNSAMTFSEFILSVHQKKMEKQNETTI